MPTSYDGSPVATQAPSVPPGSEAVITVALPADGDPPNASTFEQGYKVCADFIAWLIAPFATAGSFALWLIGFRTATGHKRTVVDHLGFLAGQVIKNETYWQISGGSQIGAAVDAHFTAFPAWRCKTAGASSTIQATTVEVSGAAGGPSCTALAIVACNSGGADGDYVAVTQGPFGRLEAWRHLAMDVNAGAYNGVTTVDFSVLGFGNYGGASANALTSFIGFETRGTNFWHCVTRHGGSESVTASGVPIPRDNSMPVAALLSRLRVEFHGEDVAEDGFRRVRFYVDGALVATHNLNIPAASAAMYAVFGCSRQTTVKDAILIGPPRIYSSLYGDDVW